MGNPERAIEPEAAEARARQLESFAARALEFAAVRALFERFAWTSLGLRALRERAPLSDTGARAALARVREMIGCARTGELPNLAGVSDPMAALAHARSAGRALEEEPLIALREFFLAADRIREWLSAHERELPACSTLARDLPDLAPLLEQIETIVDERGRVRDGASPLLARLRKQSAEAAHAIDRALRVLMARPEIKSVLSDQSVHRRAGRPVLAVRAKSAGRVPGLVHDRSQSGESVFVEPREVVLLGNRQAECAADERREVERILLELTRNLLLAQADIARAAERIGELEVAAICARYSTEGGALRARVPDVSGDPGAASGLVLRGARHPLLVEEERLGRLARVVPIDLRLGADFDLLILTGPNTGGKTLALKTAGILALLVRCGLPVPCEEGSAIPLYDGIVADIGDEQEIRQSLSTFSSHMMRIKAGLERATKNTLVLLDELGGGTDPDEGAALSEAILEQWLARASPTIVSTHIGKLKEFAFRNARAENACVEFDVKTLQPLYRILMGTPGESGALVIARRLGLPPKLVDRAQERLVKRDAEVARLMADVRIARTQAEHVRTQAESRLADASRTTRELEEERQVLSRRGELLEAEAQRGIEGRVREARRLVERGKSFLAQLPPAARKALDEVLEELERELSGTALSDRRQAFLDGLKKGSFVYLPRYRQRLVVHKVDRESREVSVQLGTMRLKVSFDEVTEYESL
jgi:DNA mismatch repair protein MutS2